MSFNNKPATDAVPLFAEVLAPGLRLLSPAITAVTTNPASLASRSAAEFVFRSPSSPFYASAGVVRELLPVLDQIEPVFMEVANGASEVVPTSGAARAVTVRGACARPVNVWGAGGQVSGAAARIGAREGPASLDHYGPQPYGVRPFFAAGAPCTAPF